MTKLLQCSMVVNNLDVTRFTGVPGEAESPLTVDPYAPLAGSVAP